MSGWAGKFSHFDRTPTSAGKKNSSSANTSFKFRSRYTPLNQAPSVPSKQTMVAPKPEPPKKQNFNFRTDKVAATSEDDWGDDDFDTIMQTLDNRGLEEMQSQVVNVEKTVVPEYTDEEVQEMTMAIVNDADWDDFEDEAPPAPMDAAKARLNQTTAVLGAPNLTDFFEDGPKPEEIINNLKVENRKLERELDQIRPLVERKEEERNGTMIKLDLKSKELEKEMRLRKNLESNLRKELERAHKVATDKEAELKKMKIELNTLNLNAAKNAEISSMSASKKRKRSPSSTNGTEYHEEHSQKSVFNPLEKLDLPHFFLEQFSLLGSILSENNKENVQNIPKTESKDQNGDNDELSLLRIT